jgi:phage shock protein C
MHELARPLLSSGYERGSPSAAAKGKDKMMQTETENLFRRRDTFFGICEAVGQDFGFNPLYLRLAFIAPLFFFPVQTFAAYFALGFIVLASRLLFPNKAAAVQVEQSAPTAVEPAKADGKTEDFALAA